MAAYLSALCQVKRRIPPHLLCDLGNEKEWGPQSERCGRWMGFERQWTEEYGRRRWDRGQVGGCRVQKFILDLANHADLNSFCLNRFLQPTLSGCLSSRGLSLVINKYLLIKALDPMMAAKPSANQPNKLNTEMQMKVVEVDFMLIMLQSEATVEREGGLVSDVWGQGSSQSGTVVFTLSLIN